MREPDLAEWKTLVRRKLRSCRLPGEREAEVVDEVAQCLEERYLEERGHGLDAERARAHVEREFDAAGFLPAMIARAATPRTTAKDRAVFGRRKRSFMDNVWQDLRYGLRTLRNNKGFALVAVLTLTLGIGANSAVFTVVNGVLLRPLPMEEPQQLVWMWGRFHANDSASVSPPDFLDYRAQAKSFDGMAASLGFGRFTYNMTGAGEPARLQGAPVSAGYFEVLGVRPLLGRTFRSEEERLGNDTVVILSHALWRQRFGGDPNVLGTQVTLNGNGRTVIGVMGPGFDFPQDSALWTPIPFGHEETSVRRFHFLRGVARLRKGVTLQQAQAELDTIAAQLEQQYPESNKTWGIRLEPLRTVLVGDVERPLLVLWAAVGFVLLIACANVASLLLARSEARQKEIAIRRALGASGSRITMQLLAESLLLALLGAVGGVALAAAGISALQALQPGNLPRLEEIGIDYQALSFALLCAVLTGCVAGIAPALHMRRGDSQAALREGTRAGGGRMRTHRALVTVEIAVSLILFIGAGLLVKSYWELTRVPLGFTPDGVLTTELRPAGGDYENSETRRHFWQGVLEKVGALPGVEAVGGISILPMRGFNDTYFTIAGRPPVADRDRQGAQNRTVVGNYFRAVRMATRKGRTFGNEDGPESPRVVVINSAFEEQFFPNEDPLGKTLVIDMGQPYSAEIIGVVEGARQALTRPPFPEFYVYSEQIPAYNTNLVVRASVEPVTLAGAVRRAVWDLDRRLAFGEFATMDSVISRASALQRFNAVALAAFAGLALLLAIVGTYGVLAYSVSRRTHEIGIRMALGARTGNVLWLVMGQGIVLAGLGVAIGLIGAYWLAQTMTALLFQVTTHDPLIFAVAPLALLLAAALACCGPALRASRVDPLVALRHE